MLNGFLAALRRSRETAEVKAAYDEFLERLDAGQVAAEAVKPGDAMPAFLLPNAEGRLVASAGLLAQGPLVVTFFRGGWCPYCSATLEALEMVLPELSRAGGTLVAMTPETGGRALAMKHDRNLHYEVLVDVDLAVAMAFGIVFRTPPLYAGLLRRRGVDLSPMRVQDPADQERLRAYIWADQPARLARLEGALAIAAADPPALDRGDAADWTDENLLPAPEPGVVRVLMHSVAYTYFRAATLARIAAHMAAVGRQAAAEAPLAWLRFEPPPGHAEAPTLRLQTWPGGQDHRLATGSPHGAWIRWGGHHPV